MHIDTTAGGNPFDKQFVMRLQGARSMILTVYLGDIITFSEPAYVQCGDSFSYRTKSNRP